MNSKRFVVALQGGFLELFWDGHYLFDLQDAKEWVKWANEKYPQNAGQYKIYELKEVRS